MSNIPLVLKNTKKAWLYAAINPFVSGSSAVVVGADQTQYNGTFSILTATSKTFTYKLTGTTPYAPAVPESPVTPATHQVRTSNNGDTSLSAQVSGGGALNGTITRVGTIATFSSIVVAAGAISQFGVGQTANICNTAQLEYLGNQVITGVIGTTTTTHLEFTFTVVVTPGVAEIAAIPVSPATGTMTASCGGVIAHITSLTWDESATAIATAEYSVDDLPKGITAISNAYYGVGKVVTIAGAAQAAYNGDHTIISDLDGNTFTYAVTGTPASPATGTMTAIITGYVVSNVVTITSTGGIATCSVQSHGYPNETVPGIVYLDGTYYVMLPTGTIQGSYLQDPFNWNSLNYVSPEVETDGGVAVVKYLNYLLAFGVWTTEVFYDNGNAAPGSPLSRMETSFMQIGCCAARSVAMTDNFVIWVGQTKEGANGSAAGKNVAMMQNFQYQTISNPYIDRILNSSDMTAITTFCFKQNGHSFYVLTLGTINITLVYDLTMGAWYQWTSMVKQNPIPVVSLIPDSNGITLTANCLSHGYKDGDRVEINGSINEEYNTVYTITYIDVDNFSILSPSTIGTLDGQIIATGYTEEPFRYSLHTSIGSANIFSDAATGTLYTMQVSNYDDYGAYINFLTRSITVDDTTNELKRYTRLDLLGDKVVGQALIRYSKDDYATHSTYRTVDLSIPRSKIDRLGMARRVSFDVRVTDPIPLRLERIEITFDGIDRDVVGNII